MCVCVFVSICFSIFVRRNAGSLLVDIYTMKEVVIDAQSELGCVANTTLYYVNVRFGIVIQMSSAVQC